MRFIGVFIFAVAHSSLSLAASFDCGAAATPIEKLICSDTELSKSDDELSMSYKKVLLSLDAANREQLVAEQKSWLRNSRSLCDDAACLRRSYATRKLLLERCDGVCDIVESYVLNGEHYNFLTLRNTNERNSSFNQSLRERKAGELFGCETLVDIAVGTAHGNHSYGGLCKFRSGTKAGYAMICNDEMLGHFKLVQSTSSVSRYELADFTIKNCYGG